MAAYLDLVYQGQPSRFALTAIDRRRLHGFTRRVALDADGTECATALLTRDGRFLLAGGSTADLYIDDEGNSVSRTDLVPVGSDGHALETLAPTTGRPQEVEGPITPEEFLDNVVVKAYALAPDIPSPALQSALARGTIFRVAYRPRKTTRQTSAFIFANDVGPFLVQAEPCGFEFVGPAQLPAEADIWPEEADGEFDFDQHGRWTQ